MQLITLNTWAGLLAKELFDFITTYAAETDIFLFQEVFKAAAVESGHDHPYPYLLPKLRELLPNHQSFYSAGHSSEGRREWGNATFVRSTIRVTASGDIFTKQMLDCSGYGYVPYAGLYVQCVVDNRPLTVYNQHGLWAKNTEKKDIPPRLQQATLITNWLDQQTGEVIVAGDFNLRPDTDALAIYERYLQNLNEKYQIKDTRSKLYKKPVRFADYVLVSAGINDQICQALPVVLSDHLPLLLRATLR